MIKSTTIENGIQVVTEKMAGSRALGIGLLIDSSPRDEVAGKFGLAHLVEHALFHGTSERSGLEISRIIDTMGGRVSAFTGRDYTCFSAMVMDDHRTYVLDLFSDLILNSIFPAERLEYEKQVVLQEQMMGRDIPAEEIDRLLRKNVWNENSLGRPIEGYLETLQALTREDVIYYLNNMFTPDKITIAMAGNLEHEDIVSQVTDCFWRLTGQRKKILYSEPHFTPCSITKETKHNQSYFSVALQAPKYSHDDRYEVHQLNTILGGGLSSRLFRNLREQRGLVYDIQSEYFAYRDAGMIVVSGSASSKKHDEVIDIVQEEMIRLFSGAKQVSEEELWQASMYMTGQHHIDSEDPFTRMSRLLTQLFYFGKNIPAQEVITSLEQVTVESLQVACKRMFPDVSMKLATVLCKGLG